MYEQEKNDLILFSENFITAPYQIGVEKSLIELLKHSIELKFSEKILEKYFENKLLKNTMVSIDSESLIYLTALLLATYNKKLLPNIRLDGERELIYKIKKRRLGN